VGDFVLATILTVLWVPSPLKDILNKYIQPGTTYCHASIYIIAALENSSSILSVLLAYTLNATIVKNVDFKTLQHRYFLYLAIIWAVSLGVPLLTFVVEGQESIQGIGYCGIAGRMGPILKLVPWAIMLVIQIVFIVPVFKNAYDVHSIFTHSTPVGKSKNLTQGMVWLYLRYFGTLFNQLFFWLAVIVFDAASASGYGLPRSLVKFLAFSASFLSLNGLIVMLGNKSLRNLMCRSAKKMTRYVTVRKEDSSRSNSTTELETGTVGSHEVELKSCDQEILSQEDILSQDDILSQEADEILCDEVAV